MRLVCKRLDKDPAELSDKASAKLMPDLSFTAINPEAFLL